MDINLDEQNSILYIKPTDALKAESFSQLTTIFDAYVKDHGNLKGLVIEAKKFPGWENMDAFKAHVKFIKDHHAKIQKIALVTDSGLAMLAKGIGCFISTQIKHFPYDQVGPAKQWIEQ